MNKDDSGFRWGPFSIVGPKPWSLRIQQLGGSVYYPYASHPGRAKISHGPDQVDLSLPIIMKGNYFENFTHIRDLKDAEVYYWDNCLIPQFMYKSPANPRGDKIWTRLVYRSTAPREITATESSLREHELRVNTWIKQESQGTKSHWQDLCPVQDVQPRGRKILVLLSQAQTISHWYPGQSLADLRARIERVCLRLNLEVEYRDKLARKFRDGQGRLDHQLAQGYRAVICTHSAAALEVLATGTPVIALGAEAAHGLNTSWAEFTQDQYQCPQEDQILEQMRRILTTVWHKQELLTGSWSWTYDPQEQVPYTEWKL